MIFISEEISAELASHEMAYEAVRAALIAVCEPQTDSFPVVHGHGTESTNRFTIKSSSAGGLAGLKIGSYWPGNLDKGMPRHNSLILLFDQERGMIGAAIQGGKLNAYRTAAANAVATSKLARLDAQVLAVFGAGHQAQYEVEAIARVRDIGKVLVVGRDATRAAAFADGLVAKGLSVDLSDGESACRRADIIVTATPSKEPLFEAQCVRAGTHISSMGSDARGKQELPPELFADKLAKLFCDLPVQSRAIGEFQHTPSGIVVTAIGDVLTGRQPGRTSNEDITIFDSSGLSVQDLFIGKAILEKHALLRDGI
jgi:ornithine cyclodeaminase